jgi:hypothetical protein
MIYSENDIENPFKHPSGKPITRDIKRCVLSVHFSLCRKKGEKRSITELAEETANLVGVMKMNLGLFYVP